MTDAHTQHLARKCLEQLEELVLLNKLQPTQLADFRTHLDPIARPAPPVIARKPASQPQTQTLPQCKALWSYTATDTDELSFKENDRIEIVQEVDAAWWKGRVIIPGGVRKEEEALLFPSNYVEKMPTDKVPTRKLSSGSAASASASLPARNLPPVYTPSIKSEQSYHDSDDAQRMQGNHPPQISMPSPYGMDLGGPPKWPTSPSNNWSSGAPPAMPPPPPQASGYISPSPSSTNSYMTPLQPTPSNHFVSPQPSGNYVSPTIPPEKQGLSQTPSNNQSYYNSEMHAQAPGNPALYGTQQPVPADKAKHDKLKKFGGRLGGTMVNSFAGGVGFGVGSHLFN